jgi:hypothetical protein
VIVITGSARTGTSLMMQTLRLLGTPISGQAFHKDFSNKELNPKGYWDLPIEETINGITDDRYVGKGIKLYALQLSRTKPELISKLIVCHRNRENAIASTKRLYESEKKILSRMGVEPTDENCEKTYDISYSMIWEYVLNRADFPMMIVQFENMISQPQIEIARIAKFVNSKESIKNAVLNVGG